MTEKQRFFDANPTQLINISPDGRRAVLTENGGGVRIRDLQSNGEIASRWPVTNASNAIFTDNGSYLVALDNGHRNPDGVSALVMASATGRPVGSFRTKTSGIRPKTPHMPNSFAAPSGDDLQLWDLSHLETPPREIHELGIISGFAVSPNVGLAACSSESGSIGLYEFPSLHRLETLRGFLLRVHSIAFSPDGNRLAASSSGQEAVKLWDVQTHQEVLTLAAEGSVFRYLTFSPDGVSLMAINSNGDCTIWTAPPRKEIAAIEKTENAEKEDPISVRNITESGGTTAVE